MTDTRLERLLQKRPVAESHGNPSGHLAFPFDRGVFWEGPRGGLLSAQGGGSRIMRGAERDRQGLLFAPETIAEYRATPQRAAAVQRHVDAVEDYGFSLRPLSVSPQPVQQHVDAGDEPFGEQIRHALTVSRMPTELIEALPVREITNDPMQFVGMEPTAGVYNLSNKRIHINPRSTVYASPRRKRSTVLHEIGHSVDHHLSGIDRFFRRGPAMMEGIAVGLSDRYQSFTEDPSSDLARSLSKMTETPRLSTVTAYHAYTDEDWRSKRSEPVVKGAAERFLNTRKSVQDTGVLPPPPDAPAHIGEQFHQLTLPGFE